MFPPVRPDRSQYRDKERGSSPKQPVKPFAGVASAKGLVSHAQPSAVERTLDLTGLRFTLELQQVGLHLRRALVAVGTVLLHRLADDAFEFNRDLGIDLRRRDRLGMQDGIQ